MGGCYVMLGCSQAVRHRFLVSACGGSNPPTPILISPDGEIDAQILENVRGWNVFAAQSIAKRPSFYLVEYLILIGALKKGLCWSIEDVQGRDVVFVDDKYSAGPKRFRCLKRSIIPLFFPCV